MRNRLIALVAAILGFSLLPAFALAGPHDHFGGHDTFGHGSFGHDHGFYDHGFYDRGHSHSSFSLSLGFGGIFSSGYGYDRFAYRDYDYAPVYSRVYYDDAPAYVAPAPVIVDPAPVYVAPPPVVYYPNVDYYYYRPAYRYSSPNYVHTSVRFYYGR